MHHLPPGPEHFHWTLGTATINIPRDPGRKGHNVVVTHGPVVQLFFDRFCVFISSACKPEYRQRREPKQLSDWSFCDCFARDFAFPHEDPKLFKKQINTRLHEEFVIAVTFGVE